MNAVSHVSFDPEAAYAMFSLVSSRDSRAPLIDQP